MNPRPIKNPPPPPLYLVKVALPLLPGERASMSRCVTFHSRTPVNGWRKLALRVLLGWKVVSSTTA